MHRTHHPLPRRISRAIASLIGSVVAFGVVGLVRASTLLAQVQAPDSEIPENAPKNWSIQFIGDPLVPLAILLVIVCVIVYAWRMIRLRYPRAT
ncbi:MAG: hypothetical protein IT198_13545 [Acidimicrobiia bacterium]|nr:hypothetical protein [Acidimicrobiia bacterium]